MGDAQQDKEDAFIEKQKEKNELKLKLQAYGDVWEYKTFKWGPFTWKRKVPKQGLEDVLRDERMHMMELDPNADPIPVEDADGNPVEPEEEAAGVHDTSMYGAVEGAAVDAPKKRMSLVQRFGKMFEPTVIDASDHGDYGSPIAASSPLEGSPTEKKKSKKRRKRAKDEEFILDQAYREPTPDTHPIYREVKMDKADAKKEGFPWDLRTPWMSFFIFISATSEDMLSELRMIYEEIVPLLQKEGNKRRVRIIPVYIQDGLSGSEVQKCTIEMRLREIERAHVVLFLQGRVYGDVPSTEAVAHAGNEFPWVAAYDEGRSFQELETTHVFPEMQVQKDATLAERKQARKEERTRLETLVDAEMLHKKILVAQRGFQFMSRVPENMKVVFKEPVYHRDVLQRQLRTMTAKAANNNPQVEFLAEYKAEWGEAHDNGTYELVTLDELQDFVLRNCREQMYQVFPNVGFGKWLRKNDDIDVADQALWALRARDMTMAHAREDEIDAMTKYCDSQTACTPLLLMGGSGAGKTSLMLKFMFHYLDTKNPNRADDILSKGWRRRAKILLLSHFTCASSSAHNPVRMLRRFCNKLAAHYYLDKPEDVPGDYEGLSERFVTYCHEVGTSFRGDMLLIMVDSVEDLDMWTVNSRSYIDKDEISAVDWVPDKLPRMPLFPVRMVLACDPDASPDTARRLRNQQKAHQTNEICIESMSRTMRTQALRKMLEPRSRTPFDLEKAIRNLSKMDASCVPMFLHYASLELAVGNPLPEEIEAKVARLPKNVSDLCFQSILRVERDVDGGTGYVREILMLLSCTRRGLLESELWQLIKMQASSVRRRPKYYRFLSSLQGLAPFFRARPLWHDRGGEHSYDLCHGFFSRIVTARFVKNASTEQAMHRKLADLFYQVFLALNLERLSNGADRWLHMRIVTDEQARGLGEVVFHASKAQMFISVRELLCSLRFVELRIMFDQLAELLEDYRIAEELFLRFPDQPGLAQVQDFYSFAKINASDLIARPSNTFQLAANAPIQTAPAIVSRAMLATSTERRVWLELRNKKQDQALTCDFDCKAPITDLFITPDSRYVGAISDDGVRTQVIHIFDTFLAIKTATMSDFQHHTTCGAFFASGNVLVTGSKEGIITYWDIMAEKEDGRLKAHFYPKDEDCNRSTIHRLKVSNDMRRMITAGNDCTLRVFDPQHQDKIATLKGHRGPVLDVDISVDSLCFVSASADKTLRVWSCESFECLQHCIGHFGAVISCSFGGTGHAVFASSSVDGSVRTWQTGTGAVINVLIGHNGPVNCSAMGVTGPQVVSTGDDGTVRVWDTADGCQMDQYGRERPEQVTIPEGHAGICRRCLLSRDCLRAISSGSDGFVKIWKMRGGHEKRINALSFTEDRTRVITCSADKTVRAFDVQSTTELTKIVGHVGPINKLSISPGETGWELHGFQRRGRNQTTDTCIIATASDDHAAAVYNINTGIRLQKLVGHSKEVLRVAFAPNGKLIATASRDACIGIWDAVKGTLIYMLGTGSSVGMGHTGDVNGILFTKDSKALLSVSSDTSCRVWDVAEGYLKALLSGHTLPVYCVDYSPLSDRVVTGSKDKTIILWNMWKATGVKTLRGHTSGCLSLTFSIDGRQLFSSGRDKTIRVWGVNTAGEHKNWTPEQGYEPMIQMTTVTKKVHDKVLKPVVVVMVPNDRYVAIGYETGDVDLMKTESRNVDLSTKAHDGLITGISYTRDSELMATCGVDRALCVYAVQYYSDSPRSQAMYKQNAGRAYQIDLLHRLEIWPGTEQWLLCCSWNRPGTEIAVGCEDSFTYVIELKTLNVKKRLEGHNFRVTSLAYDNEGTWMATGSYDKSVVIWHGETGLMRNRIVQFGGAVLCVGFLPHGPFVCAGSVDKSTKVFHVLTGEMLFSLAAHSLAVRQLNVTNDGIVATASDDKEIRLWDLRMPWSTDMGTQIATCRGHKSTVTTVQMTREGTGVLSASLDATMILWDVQNGSPVRIFSGHKAPITQLLLLEPEENALIDPRAKKSRIFGFTNFVVSSSLDGTIRVWNIRTGIDECFTRCEHPVCCLDKTPDNQLFAAGDEQGGLHIFKLWNLHQKTEFDRAASF